MSDDLLQDATRLSVDIGERAAEIQDAQIRESILADARREFTLDLLARGQPPDEADAIADDIIDGARKVIAEALARVRLGQLWEIYSQSAKRWFPATVTDIDGDYVTLRCRNREWQRCHAGDLRDGSRFRLAADLGKRARRS